LRPFILDPLFQSIQRVSGIGPRFGKVLERLAGPCLIDLLFHLPITAVDRRTISKIADLQGGAVATVKGRVTAAAFANRPGRPSKITISDETGDLGLVFFKNPGNYLEKNLPLGNEVVVSGRVELYQGRPQMPHPDKIGDEDSLQKIAKLEPIYPMTAGLTHTTLSKAMQSALGRVPELPEWLEAPLLKQEKWPRWKDALTLAHSPNSIEEIAPTHPSRRRLAYDEMLSHQLALAMTRERQKAQSQIPLIPTKDYKKKILAALPFSLTSGQEQVLAEIENDLQKPIQMCRLLQGDVGSGKTVLALLAAAHVIGCGKQAAIMAPTEILARQHWNNLSPIAEKTGIRLALLTAREKGKTREKILHDLANGEIDLLIGTHALIQEPVQFLDLALAIIDEQHRFGVGQRLALATKGKAVNILVMTATPIPRTLALTSYGDMDVSILREKPPGRKPIDTRIMPHEKIPEIMSGLKRKIAEGDRIYWVCPLVEESELIDLSAAEDRAAALEQYFPGRVGLVHGRMKGDEKDAVMARFMKSEIDILVATTVIEVGVNVIEATVMIVEHAERFGLSQLHQLRGRVGRGDKAGTCLLLYQNPLGKIAKQRLETMRSTEDGFEIAERDLSLRGPGDFLGTQQSGELNFRLASLETHQDLLPMAHQEAKLILNKDPELTSERGKALRMLLYLFEREQADRFLNAG
jgi:ATP-dependent DNA helicase RecG